MVTLDDDAARLLPVLAAKAGKAHRPGQYLSDLIRAAEAVQSEAERFDQADLAALRPLVRDLLLEVAALRAEVRPTRA
jgi:hypothetical protein